MISPTWCVRAIIGLGLGLALTFPVDRRVSAQAAAAVDGATIDEKSLKDRRSISCVGAQRIEVERALIRADAIAIATAAGCDVRVKDSRLVGQIAVQAAGGNVTIENSILEGTLALQITSGAVVSVKQSTIKGGVQRVGGELRDLGRNIWPSSKK